MTHYLAIAILGGMFVIATVWPVNMGILALVGAFLVGTLVAGQTATQIAEGLPTGLFLTLAGITWLFALAQNNGTVDWLVGVAVRAVKGRIGAIPWVMFAIAGLLTSVGAISAGAVAIVAPIALSFAFRYHIPPLMMGLMVIHGAQAGAFSPISIFGGITNRVVEGAGLPLDPMATFAASLAVNIVVAVVIFFIAGGRKIIGLRVEQFEATNITSSRIAIPGSGPQIFGDSETEALSRDVNADGETADIIAPRTTGATPYQIFTLFGLILLVILVLFFKLDIGFVALSIGFAIAMWNPSLQKRAVSQIAWPEIMLICGVSTYIAVLESMGTIDMVGESVAGVASPLVAALTLFYIGAVVSAFASSSAVLGSAIPLAVPFLQADTGVSAIGFIAGMAVAATIVDVSPFSTNGALVLANSREADRQAFFKKLLAYGAFLTLAAPPVLWLIFIAL